MIVLKDNKNPWIHLNKMAKLREELIKDIVSYLDKSVIDLDVDYIDVQNTITQIIVDSFDEYEYDLQQARAYTEEIKAQDREINKIK